MNSMGRLDPNRIEDLTVLVESGMIWGRAIPTEYKDMAVDALADGAIEFTDKVALTIPQGALAEVQRMRAAMGHPPVGEEEAAGGA